MILHIDTGKIWRGGQQQAFYLHSQLCKNGFDSIMICPKNSIMANKCYEDQLPYICLPLLLEFDILSAYYISRIARKKKSKILQLHTAHAVTIGLLVKFFFRKIILIAMRRVDFSIRKFSFLKYNHKFLNVIVCISQNIYNVARMNNINENKLKVIHSGIDTNTLPNIMIDKKRILAMHKIPEHHLIIGTIAALVDHKDYHTLMKASRIVLNSNSNVTFLSLGDGYLKSELFDLHKSLELKNSFIFAGFQNEIKSYLDVFDIFVLTSKKEGLGTSVLDAMYAAKPIVVCNSGGLSEMIKDNVNGLLAETQNYDDVAQKIILLLDSSILRKRLSIQAKIDVSHFSLETTVLKYIDLYNELLANNNRYG